MKKSEARTVYYPLKALTLLGKAIGLLIVSPMIVQALLHYYLVPFLDKKFSELGELYSKSEKTVRGENKDDDS